MQQADIYRYAIPAVIICVALFFRIRRMSQMRPLKLGQLWIVPAIYVVIVAANFITKPPTATAWAASVAALLVGAALGWQRGRMMQIHVDPVTHTLSQKGSPLAILFLVAIIGVKVGLQGEGRALGFDVALVTDAALALALGMFTMTRVEMYLRAKRLLDDAGATR